LAFVVSLSLVLLDWTASRRNTGGALEEAAPPQNPIATKSPRGSLLRGIAAWLNKPVFRSIDVLELELKVAFGGLIKGLGEKGECVWSMKGKLYLSPTKPVTLATHKFHVRFKVATTDGGWELVREMDRITTWRSQPPYSGSSDSQARFDGPGTLELEAVLAGSPSSLLPPNLSDDLSNTAEVTFHIEPIEFPKKSAASTVQLQRQGGESLWTVTSEKHQAPSSKLASWNDPKAVAKRQEGMRKVVAAAENAKRLVRGERVDLRTQVLREGGQAFQIPAVLAAKLAEANTATESQSANDRRKAALKQAGLEGAKALIEIELESVPTYPTGHTTGEWDKWVERMAAMLGQLLKPKFKREFLQCVKRVKSADNARATVIYHLRGMLINLQEHDRRMTPAPEELKDSPSGPLAATQKTQTPNSRGLSIPQLQTAAARIRQLGETICPYAIGVFVPGPERAPQDWRTETLAGLRAIVNESVCGKYERVIQDKSESAKNAAREFLLSETLTESQLLD
jgi:hypothetical protein